MSERLKVVVDGNEWYRGRGGAYSALYNPALYGPNKCCLGFAELAAGSTLEEIKDILLPLGNGKLTRLLRTSHHRLNGIANTNDDMGLNDKERIARLTVLGAAIGIDFTFINIDDKGEKQ